MTGGKLVVECLKAHGVKVIFGMPGGHTTGIYDALYDENRFDRFWLGMNRLAHSWRMDTRGRRARSV